MLLHCKPTLARIAAAICATLSFAVYAIPFDPAISINGIVSLDTVNSTTPIGGALQSGNFSVTSAGVSTISTFTDLSVAGANPLSQALTDIGDKVSMTLNVSGEDDTPSQNEFLFGDYSVQMSNTSATTSFAVSLGLSLAQVLNAIGDDTFVSVDWSITDALLSEIAFANHTRDTVNGDSNSPLSPATLAFTLLPGQSVQINALLRMRGGEFVDGNYDGSASAEIAVAGVRAIDRPPLPVPIPTTLLLVLLGLFTLLLQRAMNPQSHPSSAHRRNN